MGCEEICAILARCVKVVRPSSFVAILDHAKASEVFQDNLIWKRFARLLLAASERDRFGFPLPFSRRSAPRSSPRVTRVKAALHILLPRLVA